MTVFAAYARAGEWRVVPERSFSLAALVWGPLWLLARGAVGMAFATGALEFAVAGLSARHLLWGEAGAVQFAVIVGVGLFAHDLWRLELALGGFRPRGPVVAADASGATLALLQRGG